MDSYSNKLLIAAEQWRAIFDSIKEIILIIDTDLKIIRANKSAVNFFERDFNSLLGMQLNDILKSAGIYVLALQLPDFKKNLKIDDFDIFIEERQMWLTISFTPIYDSTATLIGSVIILKDISEIKRSEIEKTKMQMQLLQSHKMESIGRLAGGLAHDFNNILTVILGYAEMAKMELPEDYPVTDMIKQIEDSAKTAVELNAQLLAFSRKQMLTFTVLDINSIILDTHKILSRLIDESISIKLNLSEDIKYIEADANQIKQVLMNLVLNARDALPTGGTIMISTENVLITALCNEEIPEGQYILLSVHDNGIGIPQDIISNIFEPFFTTKEMGKGTGLGLATVYGIVKQHNGFIKVFSEKDIGTTFKIYLPVTDKPLDYVINIDDDEITGGDETILVVDDNHAIEMFLFNILSRLGYQVYTARNAELALDIINNQKIQPDAIITDIRMPGMNGIELAKKCIEIMPSVKVILMSGYVSAFADTEDLKSLGFQYIHKPFSTAQITKKLRNTLDKQT